MKLIRAILVLLVTVLAPMTSAAGEQVDLALVLAVDVSSSIDREEFDLQREGYAAAFRHARVIEAIGLGTGRRIAVTYVQWSGARAQEQVIPWTILSSEASVLAFADRMASIRRVIEPGATSISGAIDHAVRLIETSGVEANRRVIDVSGDGSNNSGRLPIYARNAALAAGITINGLTILTDEPMLDEYYKANVIGGPGSFVIATDDFGTFRHAILMKLVREIAAAPSLVPDDRALVRLVAEGPVKAVEDRR